MAQHMRNDYQSDKDSILKTFNPAALQRFYKSWYRPNQMAVMVVGDINPAAAEKLIASHFSKFTNPAAAPVRPAIIPIAERVKPEAMVVTDEEDDQYRCAGI